jgi:hypothetical protein
VSDAVVHVAGTRSFAAEVIDFALDAGLTVAGLLEPYARERVGTNINGQPVSWLDDGPAAGGATVLLGTGEPQRRELVARLTVGAHSAIGECFTLGRGALVGHHTRIEAFATVGPGANVAGNTVVGEDAFVGMGALVRDHLTVGRAATVAMGAVVVGDVADGARVRGVPAREF